MLKSFTCRLLWTKFQLQIYKDLKICVVGCNTVDHQHTQIILTSSEFSMVYYLAQNFFISLHCWEVDRFRNSFLKIPTVCCKSWLHLFICKGQKIVHNANPWRGVQALRIRVRVRVWEGVRDLRSFLCAGSVQSSASTRGVGRIRRVVEREIKGGE
jgi:hypothetical protein